MVLLALLACSLAWALALAYISQQESQARAVTTAGAQRLLLATRWRAQVQVSADATVSSMMNSNPVAQAVLAERLQATQLALQGTEQAMRQSADEPVQSASLAKVQQLSQTMASSVDAAKTAKAAGELAKAILLVSRDVQPKVNAYLQAIDGHLLLLEQAQQALVDAQEQHRQRSLAGALTATVLMILLGLLLTLRLAHRLANRIADCGAQARRIADGDLSRPLPASGDDELGQLASALEHMRSLLARALGDVQRSVNSVTDAAGAINAGSQELRERTQQSAQRLQATVLTVRELRGEVGQAVQAAQQAQLMAGQASGSAQRGGEVVGRCWRRWTALPAPAVASPTSSASSTASRSRPTSWP